MGVEFVLLVSAPEQASDAGAIELVSACFEQAISVEVYVVDTSLTRRTYAFARPFRKKWPEDFVMQFEGNEWYLCFHAATDSQQHAVLQALTQCLHKLGATGTFEEV